MPEKDQCRCQIQCLFPVKKQDLGLVHLKVQYHKSHKMETEHHHILSDKEEYAAMSKASNPYGDGCASQRIANVLFSSESRQGSASNYEMR